MIIRGNFKHNFLDIPEKEIEKIEENGMRLYSTPSGTFPSVTTVTGWEKRVFFAQWRKNNKDESARVCARGNTVHSLAEKYLLNEELNLSEIAENEKQLFNLLKPEIDKIEEVYAIEKMLWGERTGLAGRVDCIAKYKGKPCVIDFKGSTKPKYKEDIENYFLQATAYTLLVQERCGLKISDIVIIIANEQGSLQVFEDKNNKYLKRLADSIKKYYMDNFDDTV
jgi:genome maintenance exonuclease 1